jgi:flagellar basal body P-ring formation protein FlgA
LSIELQTRIDRSGHRLLRIALPLHLSLLEILAEIPNFGIIPFRPKECKGKVQMANQLRQVISILVGLVAAFLAYPRELAAGEVETADSIRAAIESTVAPRLAAVKDATVEVAVGPIDSRLRLPSCSALEVTLPPTNAAVMTVKVECKAPSWTVYVPVRLHAWVDAVVASVNLTPNMKLSADHLTRGRIDMFANNGGVLTEPTQAEGKLLRVGLLAGAPILSPFLEMPIVVHRGQKVLLTLTAATMVIKASALALEDGRVGESIAVENPDTKKTMQATVASDGTVEMKF